MSVIKTSYYLPKTVLTNEMLVEEYNNWNSKKILRKTGIQQRHIASEETTLDMAIQASKNLSEEYDINFTSIEFIILVTQSPDYILPTTACILQDKLGIPKSAGAIDINLGCSGYIYGLSVAKAMVISGTVNNVLLITSDTYSKWINKKDMSTRTLFGDAATATYVDKEMCHRIGEFVFGTDGAGFDKLIIPVGGSKEKKSVESAIEKVDENGYIRTREDLYMDGGAIFSFSIETVPNLVLSTLNKNGLNKEHIDMYIFHQANKFMLQSLRDLMEIDDDKFFIDIEDIGNTVSSTIPIALKRVYEYGRNKDNMKVLLAGFGVGLSWGGTIVTV